MEITQDSVGGKLVVRPEGNRIDTLTAPAFEAALLPLLTQPGVVIIDCSKVTYVSSTGLRVFLTAAKTAKAKGIKIALCSLAKPVEEVFEVSGFSKIIDMYPTIDAALGSVGA